MANIITRAVIHMVPECDVALAGRCPRGYAVICSEAMKGGGCPLDRCKDGDAEEKGVARGR